MRIIKSNKRECLSLLQSGIVCKMPQQITIGANGKSNFPGPSARKKFNIRTKSALS